MHGRLAVTLSALGALVGLGCSGSGGGLLHDAGVDADLGPPPVCDMVIDCGGEQIPDQPKITCALTIDDGLGGVAYDGSVAIERRGRSSLAFPKAQYAIELRTAEGLEQPVNLFGMGRESDWVLNGMYIDRALFRNRLFFDLFQSLGGGERYAPQTRYCTLTLDGDGRGLYLLTERVKRDDDRIPIADDQGVGASFIVKQDDVGDESMAIGMANGYWQLIYPHRERATAEQRSGVRSALEQWRAAVQNGDGDIFASVDLASAVDFVLLQEMVKGNDAYFLSMHLWKDVGGTIHFTPWDIDLSLGQPLYNDSTETDGWIVHRPQLIQAMADDPRFAQRLEQRWNELRGSLLTRDAIHARIDGYLEIYGHLVAANFERWPIEDIQFLDEQLYEVSSFEQELGLVRAWIDGRLPWVDDHIDDYAAGN